MDGFVIEKCCKENGIKKLLKQKNEVDDGFFMTKCWTKNMLSSYTELKVTMSNWYHLFNIT